jgi:hypothetical protein
MIREGVTMSHTSRVVLAPPYSGVLFWALANDVLKQPLRRTFDRSHPYYDMYGGYFLDVMGTDPSQVLDQVLSLTLLYDEILLPPSDIHLPDYSGSPGRFRSDELLMTMDWGWRIEVSEALDQLEVTKRLRDVPSVESRLTAFRGRDEAAWNCVVLLYMAHKFDAPIICSPESGALLREVRAQLSLPLLEAKEFEPLAEQTALDATFDIAGLRFEVQDLDEYIALRSSKTVRAYGDAFRNLIEGRPGDLAVGSDFYRHLADAIRSDELADKVSGGMSIAASSLGVASLIPIVGTAAGLLGLAADAGSKAATALKVKKSCWSLAPEVSKVMSRHRILKQADDAILKSLAKA